MTRNQLRRRIRALDSGERGFTLIETLVAITVIFSALTTLALVATTGFKYIGLARERQAATGIATRLMEDLHALSVSTITKGMKTSDLTGDTSIKTPTQCGDGAYHYLTCAGDKVVQASDSATVEPLNPHRGTLTSPQYPTTYSWASYVTNNNPGNDPYRMTVIVTWSESSVGGVAKFIQLQSLWDSPKGCSSPAVVHPFAGPCQPYFNGNAAVSQGQVLITGTVDGNAITTSPALLLPTAEARASVEQVSQMQGIVLQSGVRNGTSDCGVNGVSTAADGNPTTASTPYDPASPAIPPKTLTPDYCTITLFPSSGAALLLTNATGTTADAGSTVAADVASATATCPTIASPWPLYQTDSLPCSWAQVVRGHIVSSIVSVTKTMLVGNSTIVSAGNVSLAQFGETGTSTLDAWGDRVVSSGTTGRLDMASTRALGTQDFLGIPANFLQAGVLDATNLALLQNLQNCTGGNYLIRVTNYSATATASAGLSATAPSAGVTAGSTPTTVKFWNGSQCLTYTGAAGATSLNNSTAQQPTVAGFSLTRSVTANGKTGTMVYKVYSTAEDVSVYAKFGGSSTARSPSSGTTITSATSTVNSPVQSVLHVSLTYNSPSMSPTTATVFNLALAIDLGAMTLKSQYTPAPTGG
jgi:Tfp pilus assembly protein PilV